MPVSSFRYASVHGPVAWRQQQAGVERLSRAGAHAVVHARHAQHAHLPDGRVHAVLHAEHLDGRALLLQPLKQGALHLDLQGRNEHENGRYKARQVARMARGAVQVAEDCEAQPAGSSPACLAFWPRATGLLSRRAAVARPCNSRPLCGCSPPPLPTSPTPQPTSPHSTTHLPAWPAQTGWWQAAAAGLQPAQPCRVGQAGRWMDDRGRPAGRGTPTTWHVAACELVAAWPHPSPR